MKIGLINVNFRSEGPETLMGYMTPLHLLALGGPLIDAGFTDTALIDAQNDDLDLKETIAAILDQKFEIVFISAMAATAASPLVLSVMRGVKAINPNVYLVTGGVHASYEYETMMRDYPDLDFIGRGEGEQFAVDLVTCLEEKGDLGRVKSLVWRKNGKITVNEKASKLPDLDVYRVGWELIEDWSKYRVPMTGELGAVVQFSRGCPFTCTFCGQWDFWVEWRHRSISKFVDDLEMLRHKYGVTYFFFADENPQTLPETWYGLFDEIRTRQLDIHMIMNLRVTDIVRDQKQLQLYREAGVVTVDLGVEAVTQDRLEEVNKKTTVNHNARAIQLLRDNGILSIVQTIVGFPDETPERLQLTFERLKEWSPDLLHFYYVTPFPFTTLGSQITPEDIAEKDLSKWDYRHTIMRLKHMTPNELRSMVKKFTFEYNFNPKNFFQILNNPNPYLRESLINALFLILKNRSQLASFATQSSTISNLELLRSA
ncbi:B12-binding domain-containing radical SAM protein [Microcystis aeruginosa]|jgi:anaerobic magnesium-protoporphyrin IX monomethyl ester cyclase|uniref:B12-binding domain-containing radical SAM protein n=1 Tax=Microcystis aeruginosa TaxID=1126 RepID=UPI0011EB62AF|nr:radical SAM protein [Microcystis aeruginosa]TYT72719.1 radical SAM protein [Microcystis aeruginosa KLA2]